jgi:hypothetical protein
MHIPLRPAPILLLNLIPALAHPQAISPAGQRSQVPLAYIRTVSILPPIVKLPAPAPIPPAPPPGEKRLRKVWESLKRDREQLAQARNTIGSRFVAALEINLNQLSGLSAKVVQYANGIPRSATRPSEILSNYLLNCESDAALQTTIDGFTIKKGLQQQVWIRASIILGTTSPMAVRGTYDTIGLATAERNHFGRGIVKSIDSMAGEAVNNAAQRLCHTLDTGDEQLFAGRGWVAIVPVDVPPIMLYSPGGPRSTETIPSEPVSRLADVLLQPEIGPFLRTIDNDEVEKALLMRGLTPSQFWRDNQSPDLESISIICDIFKVQYLFTSRIKEITVSDSALMVRDGNRQREGIERRATVIASAVLIRAHDSKIVWRDETIGNTIARTEYVRNMPRIRREGQCAADAARVAYAHFRLGLGEYQKRFGRQH